MDRSLLSRATDNSDAPTPGYMYLDIAKNAASNPATCADIAKYLTGRLASKNNHNIKFKCLKVISKTCTSPYLRGQFKRCLSQDPNAMTAIKDALQFRGPPDPVRGDQPYEKVRQAAKEALDAVYSDTPQDQGSGGAPFATSVSSSYGPSAGQSSGGYGGYGNTGAGVASGGARRMEGIGNPMFSDPRMDPQPNGIANMTIKDVVSEAKDTVIGMIKDPLARNAAIQVGNRSGVGSGGVGNMPRPGGGYSGPPGRSELMNQTGGQWTMASNRGPGAVAPPPNYGNDSAYYKSRDNDNAYAWAQTGSGAAGGVGGSWASAVPSVASQAREPYMHQATPSISVNSIGGAPATGVGQGGTAVSDGSYEKQLIMELCPPGGMKAEPPPDKLNQFARSVANLNPDFVCPVLLDCLEEGQPWVIRAKALWVIEACMRNGQKPGAASNGYTDFFHACSAEIAPLANHNRAQIRDPAKRVLSLMGVATPVPGGTVAPPPAATPVAAPAPAPVINLLDFDQGPAPTSAPEPAAPSPAAAAGDSLFGGLSMTGATAPVAPPPAPTSGNLLGDFGGTPPPPAPAAAPPAEGGSLFGDMNVKAPVAAPAPAAPPAASAAPAVASAASLFDNMSLKTEDATTPAEASSAALGAGSAFSFMNPGAAPAAAAESDKPPTPSMDSFDPLKNMTPTTAQNMMKVSPEQMQAMMYQQMLLQQQMQMAQMMAMQQQQNHRGSGYRANVMKNPAAASTSFAFMDQPVKTEDKKFDFIQDAMSMEKKK